MHAITYCSMLGIGSDEVPVSPKRIPNVDICCLSKCTEFFLTDLENKNLFLNIGLNKFLYRGALTGQF